MLEIEDSGDAERVLRNKRHLNEKASAFLAHGVSPPEDGWGGWLGKYQVALREATLHALQSQNMARERELQRGRGLDR